MNVQLIRVDLIDESTVDKARRSFDDEFAIRLSASIRVEGLHQPIGVRPNPDKPGRYLLIYGRHRLRAVRDHLHEQLIEANIITDMESAMMEMAAISENLWRLTLSPAQGALAQKSWFDLYEAANPVARGSETGTRAAAAAQTARKFERDVNNSAVSTEAHGGPQSPEPSSEAPPKDPPKPPKSLPRAYADATGESITNAKRKARIAKLFDSEQLQVFDQMKVSFRDMDTIAAITDEGRRITIVNLIASGMEPDMAITETKPENMVPMVARPGAKIPKSDNSLSDDEWFEKYCGDLARRLADPKAYKRDAILYRDIRDARASFRAHKTLRPAVAKAKGGGALYRLVNKFYDLQHPQHWNICGRCQGNGKVNANSCSGCRGDGYIIKQGG